MSVKKRFQSLGTLYSIYQETSEYFWDETAVNSEVYHDICFLKSPHRIVHPSNESNKNKLAINLFCFFAFET